MSPIEYEKSCGNVFKDLGIEEVTDVHEVNNDIELEILAKFIWDTNFCFQFSTQAQTIKFNSPFISQIIKFCAHYFMKYMKAPGQEGMEAFLAEVLDNGDEDHHWLYLELYRKAYRLRNKFLDKQRVIDHFKKLRN